jgi:hypothetical protein
VKKGEISEGCHHRGTEGKEKTPQKGRFQAAFLCPLCLCNDTPPYSGTTAIASISIIRSSFASFVIWTRVLAGGFFP